MKKPDVFISWTNIDSKPTEWVDHNGKPLKNYFITIPHWVAKAYKLDKLQSSRVKIEIPSKEILKPYSERKKENTDFWEYFRENWSKKITKMRKMNHGYITVETLYMEDPSRIEGWAETVEKRIKETNQEIQEAQETLISLQKKKKILLSNFDNPKFNQEGTLPDQETGTLKEE